MDDGRSFVLVGNIPGRFRSYDLRAFFSHLVEKRGFHCFHFRHRPEHIATRSEDNVSEPAAGEGIGEPTTVTEEAAENVVENTADSAVQVGLTSSTERRAGTTCCVVAVKSTLEEEFMQLYNTKNWTDCDGETLPSRVRLLKLNTGRSGSVTGPSLTKTHRQLELEDLRSLPELHPPGLMPQGNVGTPLATFMSLIRSCKLPSHVIKKLRLEFPKSRSKRRYGAVPLDYGPEREGEVLSRHEEQWTLHTTHDKKPAGATASSSKRWKQPKKRRYVDDDDGQISTNLADAADIDVGAHGLGRCIVT